MKERIGEQRLIEVEIESTWKFKMNWILESEIEEINKWGRMNRVK